MAREKIRVVFAGTPDMAVPFLEALTASPDFSVTAVITQADKPAGRERILSQPPVKEAALKRGLPVFQPEEGGIGAEILAVVDLMVVVAYGRLIPEKILELPKYGSLNVHFSLLPRYRGAAPVQAAILNGDKETGVTFMKMEAGLDTGPVLGQNIVSIEATDTSGSLFDKLIAAGLESFLPVLRGYIAGRIKPEPQAKNAACYARQLKKSDGRIDWTAPADSIERMVRAFNPWPGSFFSLGSQVLKILETDSRPFPSAGKRPGQLFIYQGELGVQCGKDALIIKKIQPQGKKAMSGKEFLNGYRSKLGIG